MVTDVEFFVILKSFYRASDGVLISTLKENLKFHSLTRTEIIEEAIMEGMLKRITPIRVVLTYYGRIVYKEAKSEKII